MITIIIVYNLKVSLSFLVHHWSRALMTGQSMAIFSISTLASTQLSDGYLSSAIQQIANLLIQ